jgi:hypothetical protein
MLRNNGDDQSPTASPSSCPEQHDHGAVKEEEDFEEPVSIAVDVSNP